MRIGITDCGKFENYRRWITSVPGVEVIKLNLKDGNVHEVASCDGVLFSGGEDLQPSLYGRPEYVAEYGLTEIIPERDAFEYEVAKSCFSAGKPVLGICRGLQLVNVFLGGSLVPDIPLLFHSREHGKINGIDQEHEIEVETDSLLYKISGSDTGLVNSAHHQCADQPAEGLRVTAYSDTLIPEAMEWSDPRNRSWLLLVQWHPERMRVPDTPFSNGVRQAFLQACGKTGSVS